VVVRLLDLRAYAGAFAEVARLLRRNRTLTYEMARRTVVGEHAGKTFGAFWGIAQPLVFMVVYAFVFGVVFKQKIGGTFALPRDFTVYYLAGLVPWLAFQLAMFRTVSTISDNAHLVKQVVFELLVLPVAGALGAVLPLAIGLVFIALYTLAVYGAVPATYLLLPVLVALTVVAMIGVGFALAALGAFFRDIKDFVQIFGVVAIFVMPIVYLPSSAPRQLELVVEANPFSYMIWCYQDLLYYGRIEHPGAWLVFGAWGILSFVGGYRLFRKVKPYFANVL